MYKDYTELMKQLQKMENDGAFKQKVMLLKEICGDANNSQKIAKKYREEYLYALFSYLMLGIDF